MYLLRLFNMMQQQHYGMNDISLRGLLLVPLVLFAVLGRQDVAVGAYAISNVVPSRPSLLANKRVCISGGGPCGLFLATLLIQQEPTVQITILERNERSNSKININAFGIGLGSRLLQSLDAVPGLRQRVESVGAKVDSLPGVAIISRADLSEQMTQFLMSADKNEQCQIRFGEGCADVDFDARQVTTTKGSKIDYDLLIGADGISSRIRRALVEKQNLQEEHYLEPSRWKALRLPPQPDVEAGAFKPLRHKLLRGGRVLPRYPEGHIMLIFWDEECGIMNPGNVHTADELKAILTDAMQDDAPEKRGLSWRALGVGKDKDIIGRKRNIVYDDEALELFLETRPSRSHYMKIDRFHHDDSVALVGDAAAGMNSLLGQGCACGLKSAEVLADCLLVGTNSPLTDLNGALQSYSERAVPGAHAITDLNLVAALLRAGPFVKSLIVPLTFLQKVRRRTPLFQQIGNPDIPYEQVLKENRMLIGLSRWRWKYDRQALTRGGGHQMKSK